MAARWLPPVHLPSARNARDPNTPHCGGHSSMPTGTKQSTDGGKGVSKRAWKMRRKPYARTATTNQPTNQRQSGPGGRRGTLAHSLTRSLNHSPTYSRTHALTHARPPPTDLLLRERVRLRPHARRDLAGFSCKRWWAAALPGRSIAVAAPGTLQLDRVRDRGRTWLGGQITTSDQHAYRYAVAR